MMNEYFKLIFFLKEEMSLAELPEQRGWSCIIPTYLKGLSRSDADCAVATTHKDRLLNHLELSQTTN